jgi:hypothetical protein
LASAFIEALIEARELGQQLDGLKQSVGDTFVGGLFCCAGGTGGASTAALQRDSSARAD